MTSHWTRRKFLHAAVAGVGAANVVAFARLASTTNATNAGLDIPQGIKNTTVHLPACEVAYDSTQSRPDSGVRVPQYAAENLPPTNAPGSLAYVTDHSRGLWLTQGP